MAEIDVQRMLRLRNRNGIIVIHRNNMTCRDFIESWAIIFNGKPICEVFTEEEARQIVEQLKE